MPEKDKQTFIDLTSDKASSELPANGTISIHSPL